MATLTESFPCNINSWPSSHSISASISRRLFTSVFLKTRKILFSCRVSRDIHRKILRVYNTSQNSTTPEFPRFSRRPATVGSPPSPPRLAPVGPARPTQQGHRPHHQCIANGKSAQRHDRDVHDFVGQLQQWDDVLNTRVHDLLRVSLRLSDRLLNDLLREGNVGSFIGLPHKTLLNPVLRKNPGDLHQFLHDLRIRSVGGLLHSPQPDSVLGYGVRQFHQLLHHIWHKNIKNMLHCTVQGSVSAWSLGPPENLFDNLWQPDVHHPFTDSSRNLLLRWRLAMLRYHVNGHSSARVRAGVHLFQARLEPTRVRWKDDQIVRQDEED